ncbi:MAG TPA: SDR family oxidoreductase [Dehalococcoidia bacterium]|nr:SDR family oxidoreductase [Dehalococcoidia bacterium]
MTVDNKVIIITGAASGIGRALAEGFCSDGAFVLGFDVNREGLALTARECDDQFVGVQGDVSSEKDVDRLVSIAMTRFDRIDILFNNAGINTQDPLRSDVPFQDWKHVIDINLVGVALCTHRILPIMVKQGCGRIVSIISQAAEAMETGNTAYAASKAGVATLTRTLAQGLIQACHKDILINSMIPGPTRTAMWGSTLTDNSLPEGLLKELQDADVVYPHARFLVELPPGGPNGRVFWNSREYPLYQHFNE